MAYEIDHLIKQFLEVEEHERNTIDYNELELLKQQKKQLKKQMVDIKYNEYKNAGL